MYTIITTCLAIGLTSRFLLNFDEYRRDLWHQKTVVHNQPCDVHCVMVRSDFLTEHRLVTDRQTDGQTPSHSNSRYLAMHICVHCSAVFKQKGAVDMHEAGCIDLHKICLQREKGEGTPYRRGPSQKALMRCICLDDLQNVMETSTV